MQLVYHNEMKRGRGGGGVGGTWYHTLISQMKKGDMVTTL